MNKVDGYKTVETRVVGVGNPYRGDDGAGRAVARRLAERGLPGVEVVETEGGVAEVLEAFADARKVVVVDAVVSGSKTGTLHRFDAAQGRLPAETFRGSTHGLGVSEAVEIARALGRLPQALVVYGIEGENFRHGARFSTAVEAAIERTVEVILGTLGLTRSADQAINRCGRETATEPTLGLASMVDV